MIVLATSDEGDWRVLGGLAVVGAGWLTLRWIVDKIRYPQRVCGRCRDSGRDFSNLRSGAYRACPHTRRK